MNEIKCPKNLNQFLLGEPLFENTFTGDDCDSTKQCGDCYHCFASSIAKRDKQLKIKELEELRTEIQTFAYPYDGLFNEIVDLTRIEEIFDKHISTLKG